MRQVIKSIKILLLLLSIVGFPTIGGWTYHIEGEHESGISPYSSQIYFSSTKTYKSIPKGLVAHYSFDHCDANDNSGNGYDGKIHGSPKCVKGIDGWAFEFDGVNDYIELSNFPDLRGSRTITAWIKTLNKSKKYPNYIKNSKICVMKHNYISK
ncbi:MAG TPA: hypothetical protein EYP05_00695 [Piscirickettsiaceae bacterium]|nr:hypothetical protein [Piscirickettsiaceae bacterium]